MRHVIWALLVVLAGCSQFRTGEVHLYSLIPEKLDEAGIAALGTDVGAVTSLMYSVQPVGVLSQPVHSKGSPPRGYVFQPGDHVTIAVDTAFLRHFDADAGEILAYVEVTDVTGKRVFTNRFFHKEDVAQGARLNFFSNVALPSFEWDGRPLRLRMVVVELDKEEAEATARLTDVAAGIASGAQPQYAAAIAVAAEVAKALIRLNEDDIELDVEITFHPPRDRAYQSDPDGTPNRHKLPLVGGKYLLVKEEDPDRLVWPRDLSEYLWKPIVYFPFHIASLNFLFKTYQLRFFTDAVARESTWTRSFGSHLDWYYFDGQCLRWNRHAGGLSVSDFFPLGAGISDYFARGWAASDSDEYRDKSYVVFEVAKAGYELDPSLLAAMNQSEREHLDALMKRSGSPEASVSAITSFLESVQATRSARRASHLVRSTTPDAAPSLVLAPFVNRLSDGTTLTHSDSQIIEAMNGVLIGGLPVDQPTKTFLKNNKDVLDKMFQRGPGGIGLSSAGAQALSQGK